MRKLTAGLLLSFALTAQAAPVSKPYTFDYFVHVESGPKPVLIFGTGQTTFIQLPDGVEVKQIVTRKGTKEKNAEVFYSDPYTVVKEFHDSLKVVTNMGVFTAERDGAKTEVELAAERAEVALREREAVEAKTKEQAEAALKEREAAEAKAKEQADEIARLREELAKKDSAKTARAGLGGTAAVPVIAAITTPHLPAKPLPKTANIQEGQPLVVALAEREAPVPSAIPDVGAATNDSADSNIMSIFIRNGEGLRAALAREASKIGVQLSWSLREDRIASRDMTFAGARDEVLNDILVAFRLPGYLVESTNTLYIVKDEK